MLYLFYSVSTFLFIYFICITLAYVTQGIQTFEKDCPALPTGSSSKSGGQKLISEINNYLGIVLIGLVGLIYVPLM